jgi:hypothetical protein
VGYSSRKAASGSTVAACRAFFTTKDISKGSRLGLTQVYGFAQQSGGRVGIDSMPGDGTTVTLLLPRSLKEPIVASAHADTADSPVLRTDPDRRGP